jgi:hypothetical protein
MPAARFSGHHEAGVVGDLSGGEVWSRRTPREDKAVDHLLPCPDYAPGRVAGGQPATAAEEPD